jgi:hypothetical protein
MTMHAVVAEQVGIRLDRAEVVDRDHLDIVAPALDGGAQHQATDAPEPVDGDLHGHGFIPSVQDARSA